MALSPIARLHGGGYNRLRFRRVMKYFSGFRFDEKGNTLWRGIREVRLTRKAAAVLLFLVERGGRPVSRDAFPSIWSGTQAHGDEVKVLVHEIRSVLEDDARDPRFIRTEPGGAYSFIAPVYDGAQFAAAHTTSTVTSIAADANILLRLGAAVGSASRSECRVFLVDGERGMGKSALCAEFMRRARQVPSARVCHGQAVAHTRTPEPYLPFVEALHHLARQSPRTVPPLVARHAPTWLARLPAWVADVVTPIPEAAPPDPFRMIRECGDLLERLALEGPTVVVLDDLQWADLETVELLRALARRHAPLRTVVLATYTPFATTVAAAALRNLSAELRTAIRSSSLSIVPLTEEQVRTYLVDRFAGDSIAPLARTVHRVSFGNPLVVMSTIDALIAGGSVILASDGWRLRHTPRTIERTLRATVVETIIWRFDQLDNDERAVLECAAAVGTDFSALDVARAAGVESTLPIMRRLEMLCERGFIARRSRHSRRAASDTHVYCFMHTLHARVIAGQARSSDQLQAAERVAFSRRHTPRFG
jgi:DNA-binding winged helix-turn-helix (wHTH) protein